MIWAKIPTSKGVSTHVQCICPKHVPRSLNQRNVELFQRLQTVFLKPYLLCVLITWGYQQEDCFAKLMHRRCEGDECPPRWEAAGGPAAVADAVCLNTPHSQRKCLNLEEDCLRQKSRLSNSNTLATLRALLSSSKIVCFAVPVLCKGVKLTTREAW